MGARRWMMEYGVALVLAFLFAMILGQVSLFRESSLGKLRASDLVQFVGYSGSVVIGWLGARALARNPPVEWKWMVPFQGLVVPCVTLLAITIAYGVLLFALDPFLGKVARQFTTGSSSWPSLPIVYGSSTAGSGSVLRWSQPWSLAKFTNLRSRSAEGTSLTQRPL